MNRALPIVVASICAWLAAGAWAPAAERIRIDRVRIIVDNLILTDREVEGLLQLEARDLGSRFEGEELKRRIALLQETLTERLVEDLLLENQARKMGIEIDEREINSRVDSIIARDPAISVTYSEEELKNFILKDLLKRRVLQREIDAHIHAGDVLVRDACLAEAKDNREVHVGHVLVRGQDQAALENIVAIRQMLLDGRPFEAVAAEHSDDPSAAQNNGDLGFIARGQFVREFEEVAFAMEVGTISRPVKTQFGYHVIKLFGDRLKEGIDCDGLDEVGRARLVDQVRQRLRGERMREYITKLRDKAEIQVLDR